MKKKLPPARKLRRSWRVGPIGIAALHRSYGLTIKKVSSAFCDGVTLISAFLGLYGIVASEARISAAKSASGAVKSVPDVATLILATLTGVVG